MKRKLFGYACNNKEKWRVKDLVDLTNFLFYFFGERFNLFNMREGGRIINFRFKYDSYESNLGLLFRENFGGLIYFFSIRIGPFLLNPLV